MFTQIETNRLILRRLQDADLQAFVAYRSDAEVTRFQNWEALTAPRARALIKEQKQFEPGTPGSWFYFAIELKDDCPLVGDCGLQVLLQDTRQAQLNISLVPAYQGQGLAREAITAVLDYAFIDLDLHRVIAVLDAQNTRSARLLDAVGMRCEGHFVKNVWYKGRWADELLYAVLQAEWLPRRGAL